MKHFLLVWMFLAAATMQGLVYDQLFENDQVSISKVKIEPAEEIGLHRDAYPQVVFALKGGTITRLEADGRITDVNFPTRVAVLRDADPADELHKSVNNSSEPVELIIIQLKNSPPIADYKKIENSHDISVDIRINCPQSDEFEAFVKSIPTSTESSTSFEEWKSSFADNMQHLILLVESGKVNNSSWSIHTD